MKINVAQAVVQALEEQGVKQVFIGPPGEHVVELYDAISTSKKLQGLLTTNEYTLSFMADGYNRAGGGVGVFTCVPGPGVTNALTGITEAFTDSTPLVGIISDVRMNIEETFQLHQIPNLEVLKPVTKGAFRLERPEETLKVVAEAFRLAQSGEPGPVMIEIPCDLYPMHAEMIPPSSPAPEVQTPLAAIRRIAELLKAAKQCGLYIGRGCQGHGAEVEQLSKILQAPIATSVSGRGIVSEAFPLSVGFGFGSNGSKISQEIFKSCDTVLAIGCKFGEVSTGSYSFKLPQTLIHVDIHPANLNRVFRTEHTLVCDAGVFLKTNLSELEGFEKPVNAALSDKIQKGKAAFYESLISAPVLEDSVDPGKFYYHLRRKMGPQDTLTVDIGNHELWAISCFEVLAPGTFLCPTNFSAMGFAVPAAIAAQLVRPQHRAVCCVGDGGFLMSGFEILTAVRRRLPVAFFVFNDGALGITKGLQERIFKHPAFVDLLNPDFEKLAAAFGLPYFKIGSDREIPAVLETGWPQDGPTLIDVRVNYDKMSPFLKGIVQHRVWVTPWREKLHVLRRMVRRTLFPLKEEE